VNQRAINITLGVFMNSSILPITVIVAISLFVIKESIEFYRRIMADRRKTAAIKKLLANEVEKNNWVMKSLKLQLELVQRDWLESDYKVTNTQSKGYRIEFEHSNGNGGASSVFEVSTVVFDKILFELPVLDANLFQLAEKAYEGIAEVKHLSGTLVELIINQKDHPTPDFIISFSEYALEELAESHKDLCDLYRKCTNKELTSHKLRTYI